MGTRLNPVEALQAAVAAAGSQSALARICGVTQAAVWKWLAYGKPLPGDHVLTVEEVTGISRHELRPDYYPLPGSDDSDGTDQPGLFACDGVDAVPAVHDAVVSASAPIVACDRSGILHPEADHG